MKYSEEIEQSLQGHNDQEAVADVVRKLAEESMATLKGIGMQGQMGAPDWTTGELKVWELGEDLRYLMKARKWRGRGPLLDLAAQIVQRPEFGKGRQTFALLLGDYGEGAYGPTLAAALDDPEVWGHAVKALRKAKIGGYEDRVEQVARKADGWVRRAAQKYLREVSTSTRTS
jgi:hypothetical protein